MIKKIAIISTILVALVFAFLYFNKGELLVSNLKDGSKVTINGKEIESRGESLKRSLRPGKYELEVKKDEYLDHKEEFEIKRWHKTELSLDMQMVPVLSKVDDEEIFSLTLAGNEILYISKADGVIKSYNIENRTKKNLVSFKLSPEKLENITWSKDGKFIAVVSKEKILDAGGSIKSNFPSIDEMSNTSTWLINLSNGDPSEINPDYYGLSFSPDSKKIGRASCRERV